MLDVMIWFLLYFMCFEDYFGVNIRIGNVLIFDVNENKLYD